MSSVARIGNGQEDLGLRLPAESGDGAFLIFARPISHVEILSAFAIRAYLYFTQGSTPICPATRPFKILHRPGRSTYRIINLDGTHVAAGNLDFYGDYLKLYRLRDGCLETPGDKEIPFHQLLRGVTGREDFLED